jgi:ABC-type phosphate/phosphonate transport system permease subunit
MITVLFVLALAAFIVAILSAIGKVPLWVSVLVLCVIELLRTLPLGR